MLAALRIKNLALADTTQVEFEGGLNVITGETGAGKSILMGALELLLGGRADKSMIRTGESAAQAEAQFQLAEPGRINAVLEQFGLAPGEDGTLVIRRVLKAGGATQNFVNDSPVTVPVLKQLGDALVDFHGPHDHQSLFRPEAQLDLLDEYGQLQGARQAYGTAYAGRAELLRRKAELAVMDGAAVAEQMDLLAFRVKEIGDAQVTVEEEEKIQAEHHALGHAQRIRELAAEMLAHLGEGESAAFDALVRGRKSAVELARLFPASEEWARNLESMARQAQELITDVQRRVEGLDDDPTRLAWLDQRLAQYQSLKKKYGPTVPEVLALLEQSRARLQALAGRGDQLAALDREILAVEAELDTQARDLRRRRKLAAAKLTKAVARELETLGLARGAFGLEFAETPLRPSGGDAIEMMFAPNEGEPPRPLRQIASSGEISRIMLATKCALAGHDHIPVLVFDEIDTNVGGETAGAVGRKVAELARRHQVICITHFPQVAVCGQAHFVVEKTVHNHRTVSRVARLADAARVEELARMLGGRDLTRVTLEHAREMLANAGRRR